MLVPLATVTALMIVVTAKHFCADFLFQTNWIAAGKAARTGWLVPLLVHVAGHAILTLAITIVVAPRLWWLSAVEFVVHAVIDRAKVLIGRQQRLDPAKAEFWWLLGFDQFLHHVTDIAIVFAFLAYGNTHA